MDRREFIKVTATAGSGLVFGFYLPFMNKLNGKTITSTAFEPNAWIKVQPDNFVRIMLGQAEMGQGVFTSLPMIIADEMDLDWSQVIVEKAPADRQKYGWQLTGGSNSISSGWKKFRKVGAVAREMLVSAAAQEWNVSTTECATKNGMVIHSKTGKKYSYGELANKANQLQVPKNPKLKSKNEFSLIGKDLKKKDTLPKINGTAKYSMDVQMNGMLYATVIHSPVFGGKVKSYDKNSVSDISGIIQLFKIENGLAIVAENTWAALKAGKKIKIEWSKGDSTGVDSEKIREDLLAASRKEGSVVRSVGNLKKAFRSSKNILEATYESPFQAHATMEPMNCTAYVQKNKCQVWVGTQDPNGVRKIAAKISGLPKKQVEVNVTFLGGGFGRRSHHDYVRDAVEISKVLQKPVKMVWSREEDMQHDFYRPASIHVLKAALDQNNKLNAWSHRITSPSIFFSQLVKIPFPFKEKADIISTEGAKHLPYEIPNLQVDFQMTQTAIPVWFWRSVYNSQNAFANECFMDELAEKAGKDPIQFRLDLLPKDSRDAGVIKLVAERSNWNRFNSAATFQGFAYHKAFGTYVAQVARVSVENKQVRVHEVHCAVDCGTVIHPSNAKTQISSGIIYGLSAVLKSKITVLDGRIVQSNFDDYDVLRMDETPKIHVYFVDNDEPPTGLGEPGLPPVAPAVTNAVYAATGKRFRDLPIRLL